MVLNQKSNSRVNETLWFLYLWRFCALKRKLKLNKKIPFAMRKSVATGRLHPVRTYKKNKNRVSKLIFFNLQGQSKCSQEKNVYVFCVFTKRIHMNFTAERLNGWKDQDFCYCFLLFFGFWQSFMISQKIAILGNLIHILKINIESTIPISGSNRRRRI